MNSKKDYTTLADLLTDDDFLAWQLKKDNTREQDWTNWMECDPVNKALAGEAMQLLSVLVSMKERKFSDYQVNASFDRLLKKITKRENRLYSFL